MNKSLEQAETVLTFWAHAGPEKWWRKDADFDAEIARQFGELHRLAQLGELDSWELASPDSALALIIVLDQFSRNLFRQDPKAFSSDKKALALCYSCIERKTDLAMREDLRSFAYLPLMHSEQLHDQERSVAISKTLKKPETLKAAIEHHDIIARFGRFPHRNLVLNRTSTTDEIAFLENGGFAG